MLNEKKNLRTWISRIVLAVALSSLLYGCTNQIYEKDAVVEKVERGNNDYKYCVWVKAFAANQTIYTNTQFNVGDTIKFIK